MNVEASSILVPPLLTRIEDREEAFSLLRSLMEKELECELVKLRDLPLTTQIEIFEGWGIPYHIKRDYSLNITDIESIRLVLYENASIELSATILGDVGKTVQVIGKAVLVELFSAPGDVFLLSENYNNG